MNEEICILAPSYKRSDGVKTHKLIPGIRYVVHEFEAQKYQEEGYQVITCPDSKRGNIARVRNWILDWAEENGFRKVLIIDDDIEAVMKWVFDYDENLFVAKAMKPDQLQEFIEAGFLLAEEWKAHLWGVNCIGDKGSFREYTPFSLISYISGSFSGFIDNHLRYDEKLPLKEDYDMLIQQCSEHRRALRFNAVSLVKKDHGNEGGCADYRTLEKERDQLLDLQRKWGTRIVKVDSGSSQVRSTKEKSWDINPVVKIPIRGV